MGKHYSKWNQIKRFVSIYRFGWIIDIVVPENIGINYIFTWYDCAGGCKNLAETQTICQSIILEIFMGFVNVCKPVNAYILREMAHQYI